jgi:hypothetical protein
MMPARIEYDIGSTIHGQPLRLAWATATGGQREWVLYRDEADQRDDRVFIAGLTDDNILKMAEAVRARKESR